MPQMFGGKQGGVSNQEMSQFRRPGGRGQQLFDLLTNALTSQIMAPPKMNIPRPLGMAIAGAEDALGPLLEGAFGPTRGLAGLLGPGQAIGTRTMGREELGLQDPEVAAPGFLPPVEEVQENLNTVRAPKSRMKERRLERRADRLEGRRERRVAAGKPTAGVDRRLARTKRRLARTQNDIRVLANR